MNNTEYQRDSNMELLRIFTMFLVMIFHIDFISLNGTNHIDPSNNPISSFIRITLALASFTCVDIFVLLSGWYGIKFKTSKLLAFIFQILFFSILSYTCFAIFGKTNNKLFLHIFFLDAYWFIPTYLALYFFSPILNIYVDKCTKANLQRTLILLFIAQICYGWISQQERGYNEGCSPISFIILYLTARYLKLYPSSLTKMKKRWDALIYISVCLIVAIPVFYGEAYNIDIITNTIFKFTSPFTIISSVYLVLFFSKIKLKSHWINWIAISSFAAFLVHCFPLFNQFVYHDIISFLYLHYSGITLVILIMLYICGIYSFSILIDKVRIFLYQRIKESRLLIYMKQQIKK